MFNLPQSTTHRLSCTFIFLLFGSKGFPVGIRRVYVFPVLLVSLSLRNHELKSFSGHGMPLSRANATKSGIAPDTRTS